MALPPARTAGWPPALLVHGRCSGPGQAGAVLPPACEPHSAPCTRLPAAAPSDSPVHTGQGSDRIRPWRGPCPGRSPPRPAARQGESALHSQNPDGPRGGRGAALEPRGQRGHHSPGHRGHRQVTGAHFRAESARERDGAAPSRALRSPCSVDSRGSLQETWPRYPPPEGLSTPGSAGP